MALRIDAVEKAKGLAQTGLSAAKIEKRLKKEGLGDLLDIAEIEQLVVTSNAGKAIIRNNRPSRIQKVLGLVSLVAGILGVLGIFGGGWYSTAAIVLGIALLLKPE